MIESLAWRLRSEVVFIVNGRIHDKARYGTFGLEAKGTHLQVNAFVNAPIVAAIAKDINS